MKTENTNIQQEWDSLRNSWACPVCGKRRGIGNHVKCSKITQLKHQQNRVAGAVR